MLCNGENALAKHEGIDVVGSDGKRVVTGWSLAHAGWSLGCPFNALNLCHSGLPRHMLRNLRRSRSTDTKMVSSTATRFATHEGTKIMDSGERKTVRGWHMPMHSVLQENEFAGLCGIDYILSYPMQSPPQGLRFPVQRKLLAQLASYGVETRVSTTQREAASRTIVCPATACR